MRYRAAEIHIPRTAYAATDAEWRELPDGERIIHVFGPTSVLAYSSPGLTSSLTTSTGQEQADTFLVLIEKSKDQENG